jgi:hypothetical protein
MFQKIELYLQEKITLSFCFIYTKQKHHMSEPTEPLEQNELTDEEEDTSYNYEDDSCNCELCYYSREICEYIEDERKRDEDDEYDKDDEDDEMMNEYIERRKMKEQDISQKRETPN